MGKYWLIALVAWLPASLFAQNSRPRVEKEPSWVIVRTIDYNDKKLDKQAESGFVNIDYEKQISLQQQAVYCRRAIRIISESGVQNSSEVNIDYDPAYSQLVFHSIKIIRGNTSINKLTLSKIKTIQQEPDLNRHLYNGSLSAVLFLEDVRKGDIIEYSYTIKGANPVFKGKFAQTLDAAFSVPVYNMYYRIVVPKGRSLQIKNILTDATYQTSRAGPEMVYEWKFDHVSPVHLQDRLPSWYDPYPVVMISEFKSWKEVNDWATGLFPFSGKPSPALQKKIEEIKSSNSSPDMQVLAALRFVQDDIRYLGIELGENSHRPNNPDRVFRQRYGDCKDKSYLLCTMLRALNINAWPVLINTTSKKSITGWLPAAASFDHCTVRAQVNGKYFWFDPTIRFQRGGLSNISYPDYQCGLVISDTTTGLTIIPPQNKSLVDIKEEFTVSDLSGKASLKVQTTYSGAQADNARDDFESNSIFEMQKTYKEFYEAYYEKITADSLNYEDDAKTGKFTTYEYYTIDDFWETEGDFKKSYFAPYVISSYLKKPKEEKRTMPFSISYPARYREEIIINMPEDWDTDELMEEFNCSAFKLRVQHSYLHKMYRLRYDYEALKDHIMPNEAASYIRKYKEANENMGYYLTVPEPSITKAEKKPEAKPGSIAKGFKGIIAFVCLLLIALVVFFTKLRR